eukprot:71453_1
MLPHTKQSHDGSADHTQMEYALADLNPIAIQKSSSIIDLTNDMPFTTLTNKRSSIITPLPNFLNRDLSVPLYEAFEDDDQYSQTHEFNPIPISRTNSTRSTHFTTNKTPKSSILRSRLSHSVFPAIPGILSRAISSTISEQYEEFEEQKAFDVQMSDIQEDIMELAEMPPDFQRSSSQTNTKKRESIIDTIRNKTKQFQSNRDRSTKSRISLSWFQKPKPVTPITPYVLHSQFVEPQSDDVLCNDTINIAKCNTIKRIIHALEYYKMHHMTLEKDEASVIPLYEYISSFKNYDISMLMEDWYRCKQNHLKTPKDIEYFQSIEAISCTHNASCIYVRRYQRHRDRSAVRDHHFKNEETDAKNIILMDLLNSIHTFIFHWMPSRFRITEMPSLVYDHDDDDEDDSLDNGGSNEESYQIIFKDDEDTQDHQEEETKQQPPNAPAAADLSKSLVKDQIERPLVLLPSVHQNGLHLWPNGPIPMTQCNVEQLVFLLRHEIVDQVMKLKSHKEGIIQYIEDNAMDGDTLLQLKRKAFAAKLTQHFHDNKLKPRFAKLYTQIRDYNNPQYVVVNEPVSMEHSKFVTAIANTSNNSQLSYFALGEQYRYTRNLERHPLYVEPRFQSLKEELTDYFKRDLLKIQKQCIAEMDPTIQPILKELITQKRKYFTNDALNPLWIDDIKEEKQNSDDLLRLIQLNHVNRNKFSWIMARLFRHLPPNFGYFDLTPFIFYQLLDINVTQLNAAIKHNLREYIESISIDEWSVLLNELRFIIDESKSIAYEENVPSMRQLIAGIHEHDAYLMKYVHREFFTWQHIHDIKEVLNHYTRLIVQGYSKNVRKLNKLTFAKKEIINICCAYLDIIDICGNTGTHGHVTTLIVHNALYPAVELHKLHIYQSYLQDRCKNFPTFRDTARQWSIGLGDRWIQRQCTKQQMFDRAGDHSIESLLIDVIEVRTPETNALIRGIKEKLQIEFLKCVRLRIQKAVKINRDLFRLTEVRNKFAVYVEKADATLKRSSVMALKAVWYHGMNVHHQISPDDVISKHHVMALICYADNSEFCTELRETYRARTATEDIKMRKMRHSYFAHFGRLLYESFVFYASIQSKVNTLHHGMSVPMVFSSLQCTFDQPTSTSTAQSVATSFGKGTGMVLSFESCESCKYIRALDMSLFSNFSMEEEYLIFEARVRIADIFIQTERQWIGRPWIKILALYDLIIHGNTIYDKPLLTKTNQKRLLNILQHVMDDKISDLSTSAYTKSFIEALMRKNKTIWINMQQINELQIELKNMFIAKNNDFGTYIKYLQRVCHVVVYPIFKTCWQMTKQTFDLISRVSENRDEKGNGSCCERKHDDHQVVLEGETVKCRLWKGKQIAFRPRFTKIEGIFDVKMILHDVYDNKRIKVHFNLDCLELDGYFASLHPRWMNVGSDNSFDITLPSIDNNVEQLTATTLNMSIMIHNFEDFNIEYKDSDALNPKVMTQNMEHANMSYKCWDRLSWFYGFCNIVVSILDSISDISFIIFMWYYTDNHYFENDDQFQHENKITKFLAILSVGNLISIAIIIALYTTYQLVSFRFLFFLLFFILSPVLPAFEYLWGRLRKKHDIDNHIVVSLQYDGLLVWFKRELFRNKIFLIECVFESCFQIIIQFIAVFELKSLIYKDLYLYTSIIISLVVIISKLILCSYNMNRKRVWFNILCYFMDIFVSLLIAIFMGSVLFGNTVSFTGTYFIFEWLIFVLFGCYHIAQSLLVSYLAIPILILFCYPMTILSFSFFSMYPLFSYLAHKPMEIGKRKTFHSKLYDYCCDSKDPNDPNEFNTKLIVANYVCIKSYFYQLRPGGPDERYYQFAKWLFEQNKSDLRHITLQTFRKKADNTAYHRVFTGITAIKSLQRFNPSTMVFAKAAQLSIRMIMVLVCLGLDTFQLKLFQNNQPFMQNYGDVLSLCGLIVMILFGIWFLFVAFESCNSKWNVFCSNMICSTHDKFVLMIPSDEFIKKCDRIMDNEEKYEMDDENQEIDNMDSILNMDIKALPHYNFTERVIQFVQKYSKQSLYSLRLISTILIAAGVIAISYFVSDCLLYHTKIALIYIRATMIISIVMCVYAIYRGPSMIFTYGNIPQIVKATNFALYLSSIVFWIFTIYFKNDAQCQLQMTSLSLVGLLFIGSEFVIASLFWVLVIGFIGIPFMMLHVVYLCIRVCNERDDTPVDTEKKLLLIGSPDSGVSTLFETFKLFSDDHNLDVLLREGRSAIRQNCVSGILTLLKQSQGLYDQAPQHNRECLVDLSDEVVNAIKLIVSYKSESFTRHLLYKELHELRMLLI